MPVSRSPVTPERIAEIRADREAGIFSSDEADRIAIRDLLDAYDALRAEAEAIETCAEDYFIVRRKPNEWNLYEDWDGALAEVNPFATGPTLAAACLKAMEAGS